MEISAYARLIQARWWLPVGFAVLGAAIAGAIAAAAPVTYQSCARLFLSSVSTGDTAQDMLLPQARIATYVDLAQSKTIASAAAETAGPDTTAAQARDSISAHALPRSFLLDVCATDAEANQATRLATGASAALVALVDELEAPPNGDEPTVELRLVDPAPRTQLATPDPIRSGVFGALLAALLGLAAAIVIGIVDRRVRDADTAADEVGGVLAVVPLGGRTSQRPLEDLAVAVRMSRPTAVRAVTIVSHDRGDGRTTTTRELAAELAKSGHPVLAIDADVLRADLATQLAVPRSPGLSDVLLHDAELSTAITRPPGGEFDILSAGTAVTHATALLAHDGAWTNLLTQARRDYRFILIDTPPLAESSLAALLSADAEASIVVVRTGRTKRDDLARTVRLMTSTGSRLLGAALIGVRLRA